MKVLTFDIEEWFHLLDTGTTKSIEQWDNFPSRIHSNMDRILDLLGSRKQKATFFCLGWIAEKYPEIIRKIAACGHEIGSHSHLHQLVYEQSPREFKEDLKRSIESLQSITGSKVVFYRSPGFSITKQCYWALEALIEFGIECDCSIFPAERSHGGVPDFPHSKPFQLEINGRRLKELPMNIFQVGGLRIPFSGGGYFRLFPYSAIRYMSLRSDYLMTYFHPRDFDKNQPVIKGLPLIKRLKSYYGLSTAFVKLENFVINHQFLSVGEAIKKIDWDAAPVHPL